MNPAPEPARRNLTGAIVPALAAAALAGLAALFIVGRQSDGPGPQAANAPPEGCIMGQLDRVGGPLALIDVNGRPVTQADLSSGPAVVYFGFTHCPDVCPTTMYDLADALRAPGGFDIQPVFITLDPERDTTDVMDAYVETDGFPPGLVGLTGTPDQIRAVATSFGVTYQQSPIEGSSIAYNVDHTSFVYVMDEAWRTRAMMSTIGQSSENIAACIAAGLAASD